MESGLVLQAVAVPGHESGVSGSAEAATDVRGRSRADALLLEPAEASRAAAMEPSVRGRFIAGRAALRRFAAALLELPVAELEASYSCPRCGPGPGLSHGRPGYSRRGQPLPLLLSMARSQQWVLLAGLLSPASGTRLGVDAEDPGRLGFDGFDAVALSRDEQLTVDGLSGPALQQQRARLWVRKEAWLKMTGDGLRTDPRTVDVLGRPGIADLDSSDTGLPVAFVAAAALSG